jgi:hypothetical protein
MVDGIRCGAGRWGGRGGGVGRSRGVLWGLRGFCRIRRLCGNGLWRRGAGSGLGGIVLRGGSIVF